jgi:hypothetical protein
MQIHMMRDGRKTTISVDGQLVSYLQQRLGCRANAREKDRLAKAREWMQLRLDAAGDLLPDSGLSQWMQARIVDAIVDPALKDDEQRAREAELKARVQALQCQRRIEWEEHEAARKELVAQREKYEAMARSVAKRTPHYRSPPRAVAEG